MTKWNRIAIEHWIDVYITEMDALYAEKGMEKREHTPYGRAIVLGLAVNNNIIPRDRAIASGLQVYFPWCIHPGLHPEEDYIDSDIWFYDIATRIECIESGRRSLLDGDIKPSKLPYPFPFKVTIDRLARVIQRCDLEEVAFPATGIYIYHHPYEGYKVGQAENVPRRMDKHWTSAPSSTLLHVIETSNLDWCERFIHKRYDRQRRHDNREYFDLNSKHLAWIFSIDELEQPKSIGDQMSLLELL